MGLRRVLRNFGLFEVFLGYHLILLEIFVYCGNVDNNVRSDTSFFAGFWMGPIMLLNGMLTVRLGANMNCVLAMVLLIFNLIVVFLSSQAIIMHSILISNLSWNAKIVSKSQPQPLSKSQPIAVLATAIITSCLQVLSSLFEIILTSIIVCGCRRCCISTAEEVEQESDSKQENVEEALHMEDIQSRAENQQSGPEYYYIYEYETRAK